MHVGLEQGASAFIVLPCPLFTYFLVKRGIHNAKENYSICWIYFNLTS